MSELVVCRSWWYVGVGGMSELLQPTSVARRPKQGED
jgi:hypothetical protein